jgi:GAF domain-containing protein
VLEAGPIRESLEGLRGEGAALDRILAAAVDLIHRSSSSFDWTGIYELYPDQVLRLGPFIGSPTEHVFIATAAGVCGAALAERRNLNIPDVSRAPRYLPCSAATRSELVVLIRRGETIFGQIDIDSNQYDAFDARTQAQVEELADYLATAFHERATRGAT